jgi:hypothetical protein
MIHSNKRCSIHAGIGACLGLLLLAGCAVSSPNCSVTGSVVDAATGEPIAGAVVSDGSYGLQAQGETGADGRYEYTTWYEEHTVVASADGYAEQKKTLITKLFGRESEVAVDFKLQKE